MKTRKVISLLVTACLTLGIGLAPNRLVRGDSPMEFTVNTTVDGRDFATNGVCSVGQPVGGPCTLRAAISEGNGNISTTDVTINVPAGNYVLSIPPDAENNIHTGDLNILPSEAFSYTMTIRGTDPTPAVVDANQIDRVFNIIAATVRLNNLVIRGGYLEVDEPGVNGGGIYNAGHLTLDHVTIEENTLDCGGEPTCPFGAYGGGIYHTGDYLELVDTTIQHNSSPHASAIYHANSGVPLYIKYSTISENHADVGSTIINFGELKIINSTIADNTSGGSTCIENYGDMTIASSTLSNPGYAANIDQRYGTVTIGDSILNAIPNQAGTQYNCYTDNPPEGWTSLGHNIISDDTCPLDGTGDLLNTNPMLWALMDSGGPTRTIPLLPASPALDHRNGLCKTLDGTNLLDDQRHIARDDGFCDTGPYEGYLGMQKTFLPFIRR